MPQSTIEVYAYAERGMMSLSPAAIYVSVVRHPMTAWTKQSYWPVIIEGIDPYPIVLIHVFYKGENPSIQVQKAISLLAKRLTGQLFLGGEAVSSVSDFLFELVDIASQRRH